VPQELGGIGKKLAAVLVANKLEIVLKFLLGLFDRKLSFISLPFCIFLYLVFFGCNIMNLYKNLFKYLKRILFCIFTKVFKKK